ncbi:hypothetical protein LCGC14_2155230 [marine sediment metagenome]|uniref:Uncharacterized protein n=1 Tax=marine sediment metagenome TaxID=412755 RepID=A0A0F9EGM7_9ZZZZ
MSKETVIIVLIALLFVFGLIASFQQETIEDLQIDLATCLIAEGINQSIAPEYDL